MTIKSIILTSLLAVFGSLSSANVFSEELPLKDSMAVVSSGEEFTRMKPKVEKKASTNLKRVDEQTTFVPKGQWLLGTTFSYSQHSNDNYKFVVIENWNGTGYNLAPTIFGGYAFKNNAIAGFRMTYNRSLLDIGTLDLNISDDLNFDINDAYNLQHTFMGTIFLRNYISLFRSKRFGLFNDTQLSYGGGSGKIITGNGENLKGTYEKIQKFHIGIVPGISAFITDNVAVEVSVGVLGFGTTWVKQVTNQVYEGSRVSSKGTFKIDLFSIKLGLSFYLNNKHLN